jgi:uncharacterized repeat protein (TIGR01451 family)
MMNHAHYLLTRGAWMLALGLALGAGTLPVRGNGNSPAPESFVIASGKLKTTYEVSRQELWTMAGGRREVFSIPMAGSGEALLAQARVQEAHKGQVVDLVLYRKGAPRDQYNRNLLTRDVLVDLAPGTDAQALRQAVAAASADKVAWSSNYWMFTTPELAGAPALADALRGRPGVRYAEAQLAFFNKLDFVPNDELFTNQWHLLNTGQKGGTPGMDVNVTNVWDTYQGNGVVIGIVDSGTETTHPDLATNMVPGLGYDFIDHDNDPSPGPDEFHGTCVAGVAAARGNNTIGVSGAAPQAGLVAIRLIGGFVTDADMAAAMLYENQAISIKNNSWGPGYGFARYGGWEPLMREAVQQGVIYGRSGRGVIYCFSSGNNREEFDDANFRENANSIYTFGMGGSDDKGQVVTYANPGACLVVSPPTGNGFIGRQDITTTDITGTNGYNLMYGGPPMDYTNLDYTLTFNGTSSSCPLGSGVIALILEANPNLGWRDVKEILLRSAKVISPTDPLWMTNAAGFHFNHSFGAGSPDTKAAVQLARNWVNLAPMSSNVVAATNLSLPIPDNNPTGVRHQFYMAGDNLRSESVTLGVRASHANRGDLEIELVSPSGMSSLMATVRPYDTFSDDIDWTFCTVRCWGEDSTGLWTVYVRDKQSGAEGLVHDLILTVYGVSTGQSSALAADMGVRVGSFPDPVLLGNAITYTVTITNSGVLPATNVVAFQALPLTAVFLSATPSQGSASQLAGLVNWSPGDMPPSSSATLTVRVIPVSVGTQFSSATVATGSYDANPANDTFIVSTRVLPLTADLGLTINAQPNPALVGSTLTYNLSVTNRGPSSAAGTVVTATLPATVAISGVNSSQGTSTVSSNVVTFTLGGLNSAGVASLSISCRPLAPGNLIASARVTSNLPDPITANNTASASTAVSPAADLVVGLADYPDPAVLYSNFYYFIVVTNRGPNPASDVTVNQTIPAGVKVVSNFTSQGTVSVVGGGGTVIGSLGTLGVGASAGMIITAAGMNVGTFSSAVTVSSAQADADTGNNSAGVTTEVALPYISIVPAGATLKSESFATNGAMDIGEAVTVEFWLRNAGNVPNTNLVVTLLPGGGVTNVILSPQTYGVLPPGGLPTNRLFGFTAVGTNGGSVTAQLRLTDGGVVIGTNTFVFALPRFTSPANTTPIVVNDGSVATPYPSAISVAGLTGVVSKVTVTLSNLTHSYPDDMQVLLAGPGNNRVILMANAGGGAAFSGATIKFDDSAGPMGDSGNVGTGSYHPTSYGTPTALPSPAPGLPYASDLAAFNGLVPNGTWSLYVVDTAAGDSGLIAGGWSLQLSTVTAVNQLADLSVLAAAAPNPALVGSPLTFTFTVTNAGPNTALAVQLTNLMPADVEVVSASSDLGVASVSGSLVTCAIPALGAASKATLTVAVKPLVAGAVAASASAVSAEVDLNPANNVASASANAQLPSADFSVAVAPPLSLVVVQGSNVTYTISATNLGPENALNATLTDLFGARSTNDFVVVELVSSLGTASAASNSAVVASWGDLLPGGGGVLTVTLQANALGTFTNSVAAVTGSSDPGAANNQTQFILTVVPPVAKLVAAGATLLSETGTPPNGTVDPGETVTVSLALQNVGELAASNVVATLAVGGGVTAPSAPQSYGELVPGNAAVARPFTFTASGSGPYVATLQLTNDGASLGSVAFTFYAPATATAANNSGIYIPEIGTAAPYPSAISVAGLTGVVSQVTVTLSDLSHTFPDDLDVLLVSPAGTKLVLMSDAGGNYSVSNVTLTFSASASAALPDNAKVVSGTYLPSGYDAGDIFVSPAPDGPLAGSLTAFNGEDPNGAWLLYVVDDSAGDRGSIAAWSLNFTLAQPVNPVAGLSVSLGADPETATTWQSVTLHSIVANQGSAAAPAVFLTNRLPVGLKFASANVSQGTWANTPAGVVFALGQLDAGAQAQCSVIAQPTAGGAQTIQAQVVGDGSTDLNLGDNTASVTVTTVAPPSSPTLAAQYQAGLFTLHLKGQPNASYGLESATVLPGSWTPVTTLTTDDQGNASWSTATQLSPNFYRTVQNP